MKTVSLSIAPLLRHVGARAGVGVLVTLSLWLLGAGAGTVYLANYAARKAPAGVFAEQWPEGATFGRSSQCKTLILFLHPKCPCSRASLRELERLLAASPGGLEAIVAILQPPGAADSWTETDLATFARALPGVRAVVDRNGVIAQQFGARTSGEVAVYDEQGSLVFHGGITPARGHEGDNSGREAILRLVQRRPAESCSPAFGCPLFESSLGMR